MKSDLVACIERVPPLSPAAVEALAALRKDNADLGLLTQVVSSDPSLAARVLRLANSPFYGCMGRVGTVREAGMVLGSRTLYQVVMAAVVMNTVESHFQVDSGRRWRHAMTAARAAAGLAPGRHGEPELVSTGALLHDLGRIVLGACMREEFRRVLDVARAEGIELHVAEQRIFGFDHAAVGAGLARHWHLPEVLSDAIARHHTPDAGTASSLVDLVHVADVLAHALDEDDEGEVVPVLSPQAWGRLGLHMDVVAATFAAIAREAA